MNVAEITPLILTKNEEANLADTLERLTWASRIIVIDSGSTDRTTEIAGSFANVAVIHRGFDNHRDQWNFGLSNVATDWVLALDADFKCTDSFLTELKALQPTKNVYRSSFAYSVFGKMLRGSLYPAKPVLFKVGLFRFVLDGHTQALETQGHEVGTLEAKLIHDDRKPIASWFVAQHRYATLEAGKLLTYSNKELRLQDRIRRCIFIAPPLVFFYCLFYRLLILDGWSGIYYAMQRTYAELQLSMELLDRKVRLKNMPNHSDKKSHESQ